MVCGDFQPPEDAVQGLHCKGCEPALLLLARHPVTDCCSGNAAKHAAVYAIWRFSYD